MSERKQTETEAKKERERERKRKDQGARRARRRKGKTTHLTPGYVRTTAIPCNRSPPGVALLRPSTSDSRQIGRPLRQTVPLRKNNSSLVTPESLATARAWPFLFFFFLFFFPAARARRTKESAGRPGRPPTNLDPQRTRNPRHQSATVRRVGVRVVVRAF